MKKSVSGRLSVHRFTGGLIVAGMLEEMNQPSKEEIPAVLDTEINDFCSPLLVSETLTVLDRLADWFKTGMVERNEKKFLLTLLFTGYFSKLAISSPKGRTGEETDEHHRIVPGIDPLSFAGLKNKIAYIETAPSMEHIQASIVNSDIDFARLADQYSLKTEHLTVTTSFEGDAAILRFDGELVEDTVPRAADLISRLRDAGYVTLVFNFESLDSLTSPGLGLIIVNHKKNKKLGGDIALTYVTAPINKLFKLCELHYILKIFPGTAEALSILRKTPLPAILD